MIRYIKILAVVSVVTSALQCYAGDFFEAHVDKVIDGDTILLRGGTIVEYMGIDALEVNRYDSSKSIAKQAQALNQQLVEKKKVRLEFVAPEMAAENDSRKFAYVFSGGRMINALMLQKGYAVVSQVFPPEDKYRDYFLRMQTEAAAQKRGIWAQLAAYTESLKSGKGNDYAFH